MRHTGTRSGTVGLRRAACSLMLPGLAALCFSATAGILAWTQSSVSTGLHRLDHPVIATHHATNALPPGAIITRLTASREHTGNADIRSAVCWNGLERCVDITGGFLSTNAFNGLDAGKPVYLVHRVRAWRGSHRPVYVKGTVTVWYEPAPPNQN